MNRLVVLLIFLISALAVSCRPVIREDLLEQADYTVPFKQLQTDPSAYKGKLYLLGGLIVRTKLTPRGTVIEAVYVPVDDDGDLKSLRRAEGRYLALYPREQGILEPELYEKSRRITVVGEFIGVEVNKIDELEYPYPVFRIRDIYLWPEEEPYYYPYYGGFYRGFYPYYSPWGWPGYYGAPGPFWGYGPYWW